MTITIKFDYAFSVTSAAGDTMEGGGSTEIEVEGEEALTLVDVYAIGFETVLDEYHTVRMEEQGLDGLPDVTISITNLTWG
jgi:hypothetical protein